MRESQSTRSDNSTSETQDRQILVGDITRYLSGLARLHSDKKTGNAELSYGLRHVVRALRPYANSPISELRIELARNPNSRSTEVSHRARQVSLPRNLESLGQSEIEMILDDSRYTKQQIAELGYRRFGMSWSSLLRSRKEDALESVRAALANEQTLDTIYEEATKGRTTRVT